MNYDSIYKQYANTTIDWCVMDTKELYEKHLKTRYNELADNGWIDKKISYQFNDQGFRCPNFDQRPSVMFLGCSHTIGIGLGIEDTWSYQVAKELDLNYVNLGQGGGSNDTAFRLAYYWIPIIKPKVVFLLQPEETRTELISKHNDIQFFLPGIFNKLMRDQQWDKWYKDWLLEDTNSFINLQKNTLAISEICKQHRAKFRYIHANKFTHEDVRNDKARDLAHSGINSNKNFVPKALSLIEDPNAHMLKK